jgi:non-ribosomal peptide synthetase component F/acyl carrier protein
MLESAMTELSLGTEYEYLIDALRLNRPWSAGFYDVADDTLAPVAQALVGDASNVGESPCEALDKLADTLPDQVALSCGDSQLSYAGLRDRVNEAASALLGGIVPVSLPRGIDLVVAYLAAWRAGAAFLPVDPAAPDAWREQTIAASQGRRADGLAYVIRTSGTTGEPKLVEIERAGVDNLVSAIPSLIPGLGPTARVAQFSSPYFDGVVFELLMGLMTGATVEVSDGRLDLGSFLRDRRITHAALPAAAVAQLEPRDFPDLQVLLSVGDVCSPAVAARWAPRLCFFNGYGPTEATVCTTLHQAEPGEYSVVPIGRPIPGVRVLLLDDDLRAVPDGERGEICIGGAGVARGYLGQPEETARSFITTPQGRLYRTGDLGRMLPDGSIEFLGRRDTQVKIRGFRVELAEVERALTALPTVSEAKASAQDDGLVAHVRTDADGGAVRAALAALVPAHLVPDTIVVVGDWPLTDNGKIDRPALADTVLADTGRRAPRTRTERLIAEISAELLGLPEVGLDDVFFDLGGHSLLSSQLVIRLRADLGRDLPLSEVMRGGTVAELAEVLDGPIGGMGDVPAPAPPEAQLVPGSLQRSIVAAHLMELDSVAYNAQGAVRMVGPLDPAGVAAALSSYVRRFAILRTRYPYRSGELCYEIDPPRDVDLPFIDLSGLAPGEQARQFGEVVRRHARHRFELAEGRLIRWTLVRLSPEEHVLVHHEHHVVHDGWSFNVYLNELIGGYADYLRFGEVRRPAPDIQYHDYALWEQSRLASAHGERQRAYWRQELAGASMRLPLPTRARPARRRFEGGDPRFDIGPELAGKIDRFARSHGSTLFMTMMAAFMVLMHRYSGSQDILVGSGFSNRRWPGVDRMVGVFINTVLIRGRLEGSPTFAEVLPRVQRACLAAQDNQDLPFDEVLHELPLDRTGHTHPVMQAMFTMHDVPHMRLESVPVDITAIEGLANGSAKFELNVIPVARYVTEGHISCHAGNIISVPRSDGPVTASPRRTLAGVTVSFEYDRALFDPELIAGMFDAFVTVLDGAVSRPDVPIGELRLMSAGAEQAMVALGAGAAPVAGTVTARVGEWMAREGDRVAIDGGDAALTYSELGARAGAVAALLAQAGVQRGNVVAIALPKRRSSQFVVEMLACLWLGAPFVVLDYEGSAYERCGASIVLVEGQDRDKVPEQYPVACLDDVTLEHVTPSGVPPVTAAASDVVFLHQQADLRVTHAEVLALPVPGDAVVASSAPFDVPVILATLAAGATLRLDGPQATDVFLPALTFTASPQSWLGARRIVLTSGVVAPQVVAEAFDQGVAEVVHTFGLDETGAFRTAHVMTSAADVGDIVPVGRPLPGSSLAVVDVRGRILPFGMIGELAVDGRPVAVSARWSADRELELCQPVVETGPVRADGPASADITAILVRLIEEVLVVDDVTPEDDFFGIGGDSLLALSLMDRIADTFGVTLPLGVFFEDATIASVADVIAKERPARHGIARRRPLAEV